MKCIFNCRIHDAVHKDAYEGKILFDQGKILDIGAVEDIPENTEMIDAKGLDVYPGFVDAHSHIGLDGYGIGYEGMDYNEMNDIVSPQLRGIDGVKAMDEAFKRAVRGGVTSVCTDPEAQTCWAVHL